MSEEEESEFCSRKHAERSQCKNYTELMYKKERNFFELATWKTYERHAAKSTGRLDEQKMADKRFRLAPSR